MTNVPAPWMSGGTWAPSVCSRHGEPAQSRRTTRFISKPPGWAYPLVIFGGIVFFIVVTAMRKTVMAPNWPYCAQCASQRTRNLLIGLGLLALGVLGFIAGIAISGTDDTTGPLMVFVGLILLIASLPVIARAGWTFIAGGVVTQDAMWVQFAKASGPFAAQVDGAIAQASQGQAAAHAQAQAQWQAQQAQQPQYGQPPYGQPQYGQPQYGQPQYGQVPPQHGQPQYGQPQYGQQPPQ